MPRTKTIKIKQGTTQIDYAKVSARLAEFHKVHKNGSIRTLEKIIGEQVFFTATVIPDVKNSDRYFTGTSNGKLGTQKALEKLETIAVGRALAFAGFLSDGEIASSEEMVKYEEVAKQIDNSVAIDKLKKAWDQETLKVAWQSLTQAERDDAEVANLKESLKKKFAEETPVAEKPLTPKTDENTPSGAKKPRVAQPTQG